MDVTGQFSLGYPRADGGEEIDARIRVTERPLADLPRRVRPRGLRRRRHAVRRLPRLRRLRAAVRLRPHDDRARHRLRRAVLRRRRRRCASRATACASTASRCRRAAAPSPAPRTSAGTAPIRSTSTAAASPSRRSTLTAYPGLPDALRLARFHRHRQRHLRRAALRRQVERQRSVLRRRRHRRDDRPPVDARPADDLRARSRVAAPGGVGHRPHRAERRDGRGAVVPRHRHVARSVRARVPADALAVSRRRSPAARSASSASSTTRTRCASTRRIEQVEPARCSTTGCAMQAPIRLSVEAADRCRSTRCGWSARTPSSI